MDNRSETFKITLSHMPDINLRNEFFAYYHAMKDAGFISQFGKELWTGPIKTPNMLWFGMEADLITLILQRSILGLESYLAAAVFHKLLKCGRLEENLKYIMNPFDLGSKSTVASFYHKLPEMVDIKFSLKQYDKKLYKKMIAFYNEIRNPLFHGYYISDSGIAGILGLKSMFDHLAEIYKWLDTWFDPLDTLQYSAKTK